MQAAPGESPVSAPASRCSGLRHGIKRSGRTEILDDLVDVLPIDHLHGEVADMAVGAVGIDRYDVRMVQLCRRSGLTVESLDRRGVRSRTEGQHFQRHPAIQRKLDRLIHHAHAARTETSLQAEIPDLDVRLQAHGGKASVRGTRSRRPVPG